MRTGNPIVMRRSARLFSAALIPLLFTLPAISGPSPSGPADLALLDASALHADLSAWVVLDARPQSSFLKDHIPGARSFSWEDFTRTDPNGVPFKIWSAAELAVALGAKGIDERSAVVVYGDADKSWGGEGWDCWALAWIGHQGPIRLLAGGIQAWQAGGFPLEAGAEGTPARSLSYQIHPRPEIAIDTSELRQNAGSLSIVDVRSLKEWLGGHVPGAVHIPWDDFRKGQDRRPLAPTELRELLKKHDVSLERPVVYYCAGGIRSAYVWLVHQLSGLPPSRNYEGGMEEWKRAE